MGPSFGALTQTEKGGDIKKSTIQNDWKKDTLQNMKRKMTVVNQVKERN